MISMTRVNCFVVYRQNETSYFFCMLLQYNSDGPTAVLQQGKTDRGGGISTKYRIKIVDMKIDPSLYFYARYENIFTISFSVNWYQFNFIALFVVDELVRGKKYNDRSRYMRNGKTESAQAIYYATRQMFSKKKTKKASNQASISIDLS